MSPEIAQLASMALNPRGMWAEFLPALPSEKVRRTRKRRSLLLKGVFLAGFVLLAGWVTNSVMSLLLGTKQVDVEGSHVHGVRARMTQSISTLTKSTVDGCMSVQAPVFTQGDVVEGGMNIVHTNAAWLTHGNQNYFTTTTRFEICQQVSAQIAPVTIPGRVAVLDGRPDSSSFFFVVGENSTSYVSSLSAWVVTNRDRFRMKWYEGASGSNADAVETFLVAHSGCSDVSRVPKEESMWLLASCSKDLLPSFTAVRNAAFLNTAVESSESTDFLQSSSPDSSPLQDRDPGDWQRAIIGKTEQPLVPAWVPFAVSGAAVALMFVLGKIMNLADVAIRAARCMHAAEPENKGEAMKELWEISKLPVERKYRNGSGKVLIGFTAPPGYDEITDNKFQKGDLLCEAEYQL